MSAHSHIYGSEIYQSPQEMEGPEVIPEEPEEGEEENVQEAKRKVRKEDIWREMFLTSTGRDKAFVSNSSYLLHSWLISGTTLGRK